MNCLEHSLCISLVVALPSDCYSMSWQQIRQSMSPKLLLVSRNVQATPYDSCFIIHTLNTCSQMVYHTGIIITRRLYIFYPNFHCGLYCRAVYNAKRLIIHNSFFSSKLLTPSKLQHNRILICCTYKSTPYYIRLQEWF